MLLRGENDVALRSLEVSWEILEVRILKVGHLQMQCDVGCGVEVGWERRGGMGFVWFLSSRELQPLNDRRIGPQNEGRQDSPIFVSRSGLRNLSTLLSTKVRSTQLLSR